MENEIAKEDNMTDKKSCISWDELGYYLFIGFSAIAWVTGIIWWIPKVGKLVAHTYSVMFSG